MKAATLNSRLFISFLLVIGVAGLLTGLLGRRVIRNDILRKTQREVNRALEAARGIYNNEQRGMTREFRLIDASRPLDKTQALLDLDYLRFVPLSDTATLKSAVARRALSAGECGGNRLLDSVELAGMDPGLRERARIAIVPTPRATSDSRTALSGALVMECAIARHDASGRVIGVFCGGRLLNRNFALVDRIRSLIFVNALYEGKPMGTVTLFQGDIRVATNVLDAKGERAVGTRISDIVKRKVLQEGKPWVDRAFVVTNWYLTAYEPLRDVEGAIVGVLYVGALEKPYTDRERSLVISFLVILLLCTGLSLLLSLFLTRIVSRPLTHLVKATASLSQGDLSHRVDENGPVAELNRLAASFNAMAGELTSREARLNETNRRLADLNKTYLDLVSIVSHELKGILASMVLNTYSVRDGHLGPVNEAQKKALSAVGNSLDYFEATVQHFLNVSRIEKGELSLSPVRLRLREDILLPSHAVFEPQARDKGMTLDCSVPENLYINADSALLQMVVNNLLGNAIKYGRVNGRILLSVEELGDNVTLTVYNDGRPLTPAESALLFHAYSRLKTQESRGVRGTGLGLYLSRQIAEKHGGTLIHESRPEGNAFILTLKK